MEATNIADETQEKGRDNQNRGTMLGYLIPVSSIVLCTVLRYLILYHRKFYKFGISSEILISDCNRSRVWIKQNVL